MTVVALLLALLAASSALAGAANLTTTCSERYARKEVKDLVEHMATLRRSCLAAARGEGEAGTDPCPEDCYFIIRWKVRGAASASVARPCPALALLPPACRRLLLHGQEGWLGCRQSSRNAGNRSLVDALVQHWYMSSAQGMQCTQALQGWILGSAALRQALPLTPHASPPRFACRCVLQIQDADACGEAMVGSPNARAKL